MWGGALLLALSWIDGVEMNVLSVIGAVLLFASVWIEQAEERAEREKKEPWVEGWTKFFESVKNSVYPSIKDQSPNP